MRQRPDKDEGNAERTVHNVMQSIENPILMEDIIPSVENLKDYFGGALNGLGKRPNPFDEDD